MSVSKKTLLMSAGVLAITQATAIAQDAQEEEAESRQKAVIVTGVFNAAGSNPLDSSISVSSLDTDAIFDLQPRSTADVFRALPGIRSERSSGGGNTNIGVRGLPVSTGGAKYVSLQEDGLPIMMFGDFDFAPADGFYKLDSTINRVESVRGGTASTLTTNGPGGIINFIHKTGEEEAGSITLTAGLDYDDFRVDAEIGGPISDTMYYHIGGHFQQGGDYRDFGFDAISGGQLRASVTKEFENGYFRVIGKWLDKKDATYMPQAAGLNGFEVADSINGFSATADSLHSPFIRNGRDVDGENTVNNFDLADGIRTITKSIGFETEFDLGSDITLSNKARYSDISGNFNAPFTHNVADADTRLAALGGAGTFFNGPNAGAAVTSASLTAATGNPFISEVSYFNTDLDDMSNFSNELRLSKSFDTGSGSFDVTGGYFFMNQIFAQDWHWNQFLTSTSTNAALIDVAGATDNGILGFNQGFGWNGTNRNYDLEYQVSAPFLAASWALDNGLTLEASVRHETMDQSGQRTEAVGGPFDVDGDGIIDPPEADVSLNTGQGQIANFSLDQTAFSIGANYSVSDSLSFFGRYSEGGSFNGERQLGNSQLADGSLAPGGEATYFDETEQFELGVKWEEDSAAIPGDLSLYATYFDATTNEDNFSITTGVATGNTYNSKGIETEIKYNLGNFDLFGYINITDAEIEDSTTNVANIGNVPRRQADVTWSMSPSYSFNERGSVGLNIFYSGESNVDDDNVYKMPSATIVGAFADWNLTDALNLSINASNLTDEVFFTEAENGRIFDTDGDGTNDVIVARSINGRVVSAALRYRF